MSPAILSRRALENISQMASKALRDEAREGPRAEAYSSSVVPLKLRHLSFKLSLFTTKRTKDTKNGELD